MIVIEMFLTAQLVITIFLLAAEKHKGTFLAPVGIGLSLFIAELSGVFFTGGKCCPIAARLLQVELTSQTQDLSTPRDPSDPALCCTPSQDITGSTGLDQCLDP